MSKQIFDVVNKDAVLDTSLDGANGKTVARILLDVTTAYEAGFGMAFRDVKNPYDEGTYPHRAWEVGKMKGEERYNAGWIAEGEPEDYGTYLISTGGHVEQAEFCHPTHSRLGGFFVDGVLQRVVDAYRPMPRGYIHDGGKLEPGKTPEIFKASGS
jgi:hypothetical protein